MCFGRNVSVYGVNGSYEKWYYNFDLSCEMKSRSRFKQRLTRKSMHWLNESEVEYPIFEPTEQQYIELIIGFVRRSVLPIFNGVCSFLGMVLIIYYKQITEGYEDQDRFQILMKVGMTQKSASRLINSQVCDSILPTCCIVRFLQHLHFNDRKNGASACFSTENSDSGGRITPYLVFALFYIIVYLFDFETVL